WKVRVSVGLGRELPLKVHPRSDGLPCRVEDRKGLIASNLDQRPAAKVSSLLAELAELPRQPRGRLGAVLLGEPGVPADVGDQERANGCMRSHSHSLRV